MFATLESFSLFFFASLAVIILLIAFEDKLVMLEKKYDRKKARKKATAQQTKNVRVNRNNIRTAPVRRCPANEIKGRGYAA